jgi:hypothetical protein
MSFIITDTWNSWDKPDISYSFIIKKDKKKW